MASDARLALLARRFARAYLRWEVDRASSRDVRTLLELSSPELAAKDFSALPRVPASAHLPPQAQLIAVRVSRESQIGQEVSADAQIRRAGRADQLNLVLAPTPQGVRVTALIAPDGA